MIKRKDVRYYIGRFDGFLVGDLIGAFAFDGFLVGDLIGAFEAFVDGFFMVSSWVHY